MLSGEPVTKEITTSWAKRVKQEQGQISNPWSFHPRQRDDNMPL